MSEERVNLNDYDIPETYEFRGYEYNLWTATVEEWYARCEAHGVRDGYVKRMYGKTRACVKKWVIDGQVIWAVYAL